MGVNAKALRRGCVIRRWHHGLGETLRSDWCELLVNVWHSGVICIPNRQTVVQWPKPPLRVSPVGAKVQTKEDFCHAEQQRLCKTAVFCWAMSGSDWDLLLHGMVWRQKGGNPYFNLSVSSVLDCLLPCQPQYCTLITVLGRLKFANLYIYIYILWPHHSWACLMGLNRIGCVLVKLTALWLRFVSYLFSYNFRVLWIKASLSCLLQMSVFLMFCLSCFLPLCDWYPRSHPCKHPLAAKLQGQEAKVCLQILWCDRGQNKHAWHGSVCLSWKGIWTLFKKKFGWVNFTFWMCFCVDSIEAIINVCKITHPVSAAIRVFSLYLPPYQIYLSLSQKCVFQKQIRWLCMSFYL